MTRLAISLGVAVSTLLAAAPALSADYFGSDTSLRSSFDNTLDNSDQDDSLSFQLGVRYWYSWGAQSFAINSGLAGDRGTMNENDTSQSPEGYFRVDDASTNTYLKGMAGMAFSTQGTATDNTGTSTVSNGKISYAGADFGYSWINSKTASFGPFAGYMYWNDSPNTYADNYTTATSAADISFDPVTGQTTLPGASQPNDIELNMLRLGVSGKADLGQYFDISGEVAAVPYAKISGILGAGSGFASVGQVSYDNQSNPSFGPTGPTGGGDIYNVHNVQSSPTSIDGWGYGAQAELMLGFHPTNNLSFGLGGRAWYVQGTADAIYSRAAIGDPTDSHQPVAGTPANNSTTPPTPATPGQLNSPNFDTAPTFSNQQYISRANPFSVFRYGLLAQMTYNF